MSSQEKDMLVTMAKLTLGSAEHIRKLQSAVITNIKISSTSEVITQTKASMETYIARQRQLKQEGKSAEQVADLMGPAHIHIFNAVMAVAAAGVKSTQDQEALK